MPPIVEVRLLGPADARPLADFFEIIAADSEGAAHFHPHPFDEATARDISQRACERRDRYFAAVEAGTIVGYGMLRGWDEGYEVPAFGVYVAPGARGRGLAARLLEYAIFLASEAGCTELMLKVYEDNLVARRLYESRGFVMQGRTPDGRQLIGRLRLRT